MGPCLQEIRALTIVFLQIQTTPGRGGRDGGGREADRQGGSEGGS